MALVRLLGVLGNSTTVLARLLEVFGISITSSARLLVIRSLWNLNYKLGEARLLEVIRGYWNLYHCTIGNNHP